MVWLIGKGDTSINQLLWGVFRPPGPEPSIPSSSGHRNHGAPWEVARDNINLKYALVLKHNQFAKMTETSNPLTGRTKQLMNLLIL